MFRNRSDVEEDERVFLNFFKVIREDLSSITPMDWQL